MTLRNIQAALDHNLIRHLGTRRVRQERGIRMGLLDVPAVIGNGHMPGDDHV